MSDKTEYGLPLTPENLPEIERRRKQSLKNTVEEVNAKNTRVAPTSRNVITLAHLQPKATDWLCSPFLARSKLSLLASKGGAGKTAVWCYIAAELSKGNIPFTDKKADREFTVFIAVREDGLEDGIIPRLMAYGAVMENIRTYDKHADFDLARDVEDLQKDVRLTGGCDFMIIDPVSVAVEGDANSQNTVKRALKKIEALAEALNCAVLAIHHTRKGGFGAIDEAFTGSNAYRDTARVGMMIVQGEGGLNYLGVVKTNIAHLNHGIKEFKITAVNIPCKNGNINTAKVEWLRHIDGNSYDLLSQIRSAQTENKNDTKSKLEDAIDFLKYELRDGAKPAKEIERKAANEGISKRTLERARRELGIKAEKRIGGFSWWELPTTTPPNESLEDLADLLDDGEVDIVHKQAQSTICSKTTPPNGETTPPNPRGFGDGGGVVVGDNLSNKTELTL